MEHDSVQVYVKYIRRGFTYGFIFYEFKVIQEKYFLIMNRTVEQQSCILFFVRFDVLRALLTNELLKSYTEYRVL